MVFLKAEDHSIVNKHKACLKAPLFNSVHMTAYRLLLSLPGKPRRTEVWRGKKCILYSLPPEASESQKFYSQWGTVKAFSEACLCCPSKKRKSKTPSLWFLSTLCEVKGACSASDYNMWACLEGWPQNSMHHLGLWCWTELRGKNVSASLGLLLTRKNIDWSDDRALLVQLLILGSPTPVFRNHDYLCAAKDSASTRSNRRMKGFPKTNLQQDWVGDSVCRIHILYFHFLSLERELLSWWSGAAWSRRVCADVPVWFLWDDSTSFSYHGL